MAERGDEIWVWQERTEKDGIYEWGVITAYIPSLQFHGPLMHRRQVFVQGLRPIAAAHSRKTGNPVRLAHFTLKAAIND
jgi:hypothetical protein